ncbi:protein kinase-like protein [Mucilaginibacter yixingensis]|uniref:non-specific serine/threonine protein kinase n=1 Tax=Mucilaginibacter yixingensis TaxID=1295612 RepID=A0A2T5J4E2_9SPHI|nr:protein kinase [Mucilaginibacter yixingensis]PTQ92137.1 protein kinase-like protein [Mucilaginibacter yixingensis]
MEKAFYIHLQNYAPLLKAERIPYKEDDKCLTSGLLSPTKGFMIFISCKTLQTPDLLRTVLPYLKKTALPFRLIKNQSQQYRLNSGVFGEEECGKVISIYLQDAELLQSITSELIVITQLFKGPVVSQAQQLADVLYLQQVNLQDDQVLLTRPKPDELPIPIPKQYLRKAKSNSILGGGYLPVQTLRKSPKGDVIKAINLKGFAFNWCLIKQGKPVALDDHFDRDMKDRLLWQREIIQRVQANVHTPQYIDYFERNGACYLITEFAEGLSFGQAIRDILNGTEWSGLNIQNRSQILIWYLQAIGLVDKIHQHGLIHRDITDSNFIILKNGELCIIDFELTYSLTEQLPNPPFLLGTFGYAAPEQLEYAVPDQKEDIYSLGALLCFALTGCPPREFLDTTLQITKAKLLRLTQSPLLTATVIHCLAPQRKERPALATIQLNIHQALQALTYENPATKPQTESLAY